MKYSVVDMEAQPAGEVELSDAVFGIEEIRTDIVHRMVCYQLAGRRSGTRKTKSRSEVLVRKGKAHAQKRTGRARKGSRNSPLFVGGGVAHGPVVRSHATKLPKKIRALALRHVLSAKTRDGSLIVVTELSAASPRTSELARQIKGLGADKALIVGETESNFKLAVANLSSCKVTAPAGLNVYDILRHGKLVVTRDVVAGLHSRLEPASEVGV